MVGAIVHEWVSEAGGSEKVFETIASTFPDAQVHVLWNDAEGRFGERRVHETWMARSPVRRSKVLALPLMPATWRRRSSDLDLDWMLVSSHLFAHHARFLGVNRDIPKYVYVHTPARYIWTPELDARGSGGLAKLGSAGLKPLDRRRAQEARSLAANSQFVRERIQSTWNRDAQVIHPPVEVALIQANQNWADEVIGTESEVLEALPPQFVLGASRFIPYKRLDRVIAAAESIDLPVVLAGGGPLEAQLRARAGRASVPVTFVASPSDQLLYALYQRAQVFVFPAVEDFGIMPVEAMASGTPVVANRVGGAAESVVDGVTGALTDFRSDAELRTAMEVAIGTARDRSAARALDFSKAAFEARIRDFVGAES